MTKKDLPADLFRQITHSERFRVPSALKAEHVKDSVVLWRASTPIARLDAQGQQVRGEDGLVIMERFEPGDEVPEWALNSGNLTTWIKTGRVYCKPLPVKDFSKEVYAVNKSYRKPPEKPAEAPKPAEPVAEDTPPPATEPPAADEPPAEEPEAPAETKVDLAPLRGLKKSATLQNIKDAFDQAGIDYPAGGSKTELRDLVNKHLGITGEGDS